MSVQAMAWVLDHSQATLGTRLVAISVANHADKDGQDAWASVALYAQEARLSERQVQYALRKLERMGEIQRTGVHGYRADRMTSVYAVVGMGDGVQDVRPVDPVGVQSTTRRGAIHDTNGVQPVAPKPSLEPSKNRPTTSVSFGEFFETYPRHDDLIRAEKAYEKAIKKADPIDLLLGARRYRDDPNREDEYTKQAATWLNAGSWMNGPLPARNGKRDPAAEILKEAMRRGFDPSDGSSSAVPELLSGS